MNPTERRHNDLVHKLFNNPKYLCLDYNNIIKKSREVELYKSGEIFAKPDLIFETLNNIYFIEVKGINSRMTRRKGKEQLLKMEEYMLEFETKQSYTGLILPKSNSITVNFHVASYMAFYNLNFQIVSKIY